MHLGDSRAGPYLVIQTSGCRVLVIVPAYNEVRNLPKVIGDLGEHCPE